MTNNVITTIEINESAYTVFYKDVYLGTFERDVDGLFYFWVSEKTSGCWGSGALRLIASKLDKLNLA